MRSGGLSKIERWSAKGACIGVLGLCAVTVVLLSFLVLLTFLGYGGEEGVENMPFFFVDVGYDAPKWHIVRAYLMNVAVMVIVGVSCVLLFRRLRALR